MWFLFTFNDLAYRIAWCKSHLNLSTAPRRSQTAVFEGIERFNERTS
jgi:hypothetical protein